jgi:antirestriction protein ArdC
MDVYQIVTERIISLLEQGTCPWRKPWATSSGMPKNLISKKEYRGINVFLLGCQEYSSPYWLTYKQAIEKNGNVRKGEKSSLCVFWKLNSTPETGGTEETDLEAVTPVTSVTPGKSSYLKSAPILKYYNLFNLEQCDGIVSPTQEVPTYSFTPIEKAEQIVSGMKDRPEISYGGNKASYSPASDKIRMPYEDRFEKNEEFYSVLFHELGHSTGHRSRLARKEVMEKVEFGSESYGSEELVAELTSSMLCGVAGISNQTIDLAASYLDGWLTVIKKDKKAIVVAAAQAQKAADHILGRTFGAEEQHVL